MFLKIQSSVLSRFDSLFVDYTKLHITCYMLNPLFRFNVISFIHKYTCVVFLRSEMAVQEWVNSSRGHFLKNNTNMTVPIFIGSRGVRSSFETTFV